MKIFKSKKFNKLIFILSLIVFIVSLAFIVKIWIIEPNQNKSTLKEIEDIYYKDDSEPPLDRGDLNSLISINSDIKGWIKLNNSVINYPVLQSEKSDPTFYLYRNYKKIDSSFGSIFLDSLCDISKPSKNLILYGHNMRDGSMFGTLIKFDNLDFYKEHPVFMFDTLAEQADWKIISIFKTNTLPEQGELFNYLMIDFASDDDFINFVYNVKIRSLINTPVDISKNDTLITLSTCSYEMKDFRTVVVARKVRPGESNSVDVQSASVNSSPLMPAGYYSRYGGVAPLFDGFSKDLENGKISWYIQ